MTQQTHLFLKSLKKIKKIYSTQFTLDSLQSEYFKKPSKEIKDLYRKHLVKIKAIESNFISASKGKLVNHFIKASLRYNSPVIFDRPINYIRSSVAHFFDHVDFSNQSLRNSTFLFDKVSEYVLFLNFAVNPKQKEENYKKASKVAIGKAPTTAFKAEVINYLISQFSEIQNATLVDHLFANYFDKLPKENQNILFKNQILALLIFYSTGCPHCLREVPEIYEYMKGKNNTKVIAFAMENSDDIWSDYRLKMPGWHHILGLGKWNNLTARTYQVNTTPSYFVLGMDKQIIAIPKTINDLKIILKELN